MPSDYDEVIGVGLGVGGVGGWCVWERERGESVCVDGRVGERERECVCVDGCVGEYTCAYG
jgi:hypothetical protein